MWLALILVGVVLIILGVAVSAAKFLIWLGIVVAIISIVMSLVGRSRTGV